MILTHCYFLLLGSVGHTNVSTLLCWFTTKSTAGFADRSFYWRGQVIWAAWCPIYTARSRIDHGIGWKMASKRPKLSIYLMVRWDDNRHGGQLPVNRLQVVGKTDLTWVKECERLLGFEPPDSIPKPNQNHSVLDGARIRLKFLKCMELVSYLSYLILIICYFQTCNFKFLILIIYVKKFQT